MATTAQKPKKLETSRDVQRGNLQGSAFAAAKVNQARRSSGGKKKGKGKKRLMVPPVGGWPGGAAEINGLDRPETYRNKEKMRLSECFKKGKVIM